MCENRGNSHLCICTQGFEGSYCQVDIDECAANPCQNGGKCNDLVNHYTCDCPPGFQGTLSISY